MNVSLTTWFIVIGAILALIVVDLLTVSRKPHEVKFKEAATWSIFYILYCSCDWLRCLGLAKRWFTIWN